MMLDPDLPDTAAEWSILGREGDSLYLSVRCLTCRRSTAVASHLAREWFDGHDCACPFCDAPTHTPAPCPEEA